MPAEPFNIGNKIGAFLIKEGRRSDPNQLDREVYENGVEADATKCAFFGFVDEDDNGDKRVYKAHVDNGSGLDAHDHLEHLKKLFHSGTPETTTAALGADENKGIGARVASLAWNMAGVDFYARSADEAKKGDPWHLVRLVPEGVHTFSAPDGAPTNIIPATKVETDQFKTWAPKHGMVVVFRGDTSTEDTWTSDSWKKTYEYMQKRYLTFPVPLQIDGEVINGLAVQARSDYRYTVPSLREYYATHAGPTGTITLSDGAVIEWFVFDHMSGRGKKPGPMFDAIKPKGVGAGKPYGVRMETGPGRKAGFRGLALLDHNELFEHSAHRMAAFDVIGTAVHRVSLIITPAPGTVDQTTNRQHLEALGGGQLPFEQWGKEFSENMPDPIKALMESQWSHSDTISAKDLDRLDPEWYKRIVTKQPPIFMVDPDGDSAVNDPQNIVAREGGSGGVRNGPNPPNPGPGPNPGPNPGALGGARGGKHHSADRQKGTKIRHSAMKAREEDVTYLDLDTVWLDDVQWLDTISDDPENEAVRSRGWAWIPNLRSNKIFLRKSGDPFEKTKAKFLEKSTQPSSKVKSDVESAYALEAIAKIVHVRDGVFGWSEPDKMDQLEGLHFSFALMGLNSVEQTVERFLRKTSGQKTTTTTTTTTKTNRKRSTP